ncbi:hypothetical protein KCU81_g3998, partial [Aureobasidium melanogenum]|uniref:Uncharacterized protein n=1 Tax=Aureobasidium melanogenum (strain CBS 110374) TaxID=1043003 RepID=A0A074VIA8_AURM1
MDNQSSAQHSRPSMAPPSFGYYPQHPFWAATMFEKYVGKMPTSGYSTAQIDSVFFHLRLEMLELESRQSLDANTMWFRGEVERLRAERDGLLRVGEEAASARLAHERAQIAHRNAQATHERVLRVHQNTEGTLRDIVREGNERNALLATQLASVQLAHEKAQIAHIDLQTVHQKAQLDHKNTKRALEKEIRAGRDKYVTSESEKYLLERDIAMINEKRKEEKKKFEDDLLAIKKERDDLRAKCADFESQSSNPIIRFVNKKQQIRQTESHIEEIWSQALQSIIRGKVNDKINIDNSVLIKILPPAISSIDKFTFKQQPQYCFAQSYVAKSYLTNDYLERSFYKRHDREDLASYDRFDEPVQLRRRELFLLDLISEDVGAFPFPTGIGHELDLMIYLERSLLQDIRLRQASDTAVLFAFDYLIRMTRILYLEFVHSMACIHLAVLGMQYVMHDRAEWYRLVREVVTNENITDEPVINACHAYLALSTHDPKSLMKPELAKAFELGRFSASTPIAIIVSLTNGATSATVNGIDIVVAQSYEWEVVFWKGTGAQAWSCSIGRMEVKMIDGGLCEVKWGPDAEHQIVCRVSDISESDLGYYLYSWHDIELVYASVDGEIAHS